MKRTLLIMLCALTLCACNNRGEGPFSYPPGEPGCRVRKFSSVHAQPSTFHFVGQSSIAQSSKCQITVKSVTSATNDEYHLNDFEEYLTQQFEDHIGRELQPGEGYRYADAKLTNLTLCADDVFMGRQVGENIIDLFEVYCDIPLFTFPDGQLLQYMDKYSPVTCSYQEFIEKDSFTPL